MASKVSNATAYKYAPLAKPQGVTGHVTTVTTAGALFSVAHATRTGKVALCGHNLHNAAKLQACRRNWVYVPVGKVRLCKGCAVAPAVPVKAAKPTPAPQPPVVVAAIAPAA